MPKKNKLRKPYKSFPLTPHPTGQWCKEAGGVLYYFAGTPEEALGEYNVVWPTIVSTGLDPRTQQGWRTSSGCELGKLLNGFRLSKLGRLEEGELSQSQYDSYVSVCDLLVKAFSTGRIVESLGPADFRAFRAQILGGDFSALTIKHYISFTRSIFIWGEAEGLFDRAPKYGDDFRPPKAKKEGGSPPR